MKFTTIFDFRKHKAAQGAVRKKNMIHTNKKTSVVVPVYNEIDNIKLFHEELSSTLSEIREPYEIIYVDDNSTDGTWEYLEGIKTIRGENAGRMHDAPHRRNALEAPEGKIRVLRKVGKKGKAFSLKEGFDSATGSLFVMIDGDLQYPVAAIPHMLKKLKKADVVVAERKNYKDSALRRTMSKTFRTVFGKFLFGLSMDIQSGLKVFKREVYETVQLTPKSAWTFDLDFLYRASLAGFRLDTFNITFAPRVKGASKVNILRTPFEIGMNALSLKYNRLNSFAIKPEEGGTMRGAGTGYKKKKYVTHTTLPVAFSALQTFSLFQKILMWALPILFIAGLILTPIPTLKLFVSLLSVLYFVDTLFNLFVINRSLRKEVAISIPDEQLREVDEAVLPIYTILCPLYKEAHVVPQFLEGIAKLDWPKAKLDVMFLLEEDDVETIEAFNQFTLPYYARTVIVPHSMPKTKPKACNYGLSYARGEYLVIYDAEDVPDPMQLKKAYLGFKQSPDSVQCLQAKLNYYNSNQNLLTRFFTAEYSLWFDVMLPGLQSLNSSLPLGGTSNHFKTQTLRELEGWDPFNVTEDADLGIRLFQKGYQTAVIDSTTYEEATSKPKIWLKQRSRWLKGYMQTYLVHMRHFRQFVKDKGLWHNIIFQFAVGGKILFILVNPLLWIITLLYFTNYSLMGPVIEAIYAPPVLYLAVFSWIFGNFLFLYYYMIGVGKRGQWDIAKYVFLIPAYWFMLSVAGMIGFYQLLFKPHYWEKTSHGFHLGPKPQSKPISPVVQPTYQPAYQPAHTSGWMKRSGAVGFAGGRVAKKVSWLSKVSSLSKDFLSVGLPLLAMVGLDVLMAGFVLPPQQAETYLIASFFIKAAMIILHFSGSSSNVIGGISRIFENNLGSLFGLMEKQATRRSWKDNNMRILIFNWRDTKHVYSGGAEVYIHELARRWVKDGNKVTLFCGNDNKNATYEKINGVEIYRRGGMYTVYLFAVLYYFLKFRGKYDAVVDCENGIPFFTPLFVRKPIVLLVHHVHQEVFRAFLKFPLRNIAAFLEAKMMPFVYKNKTIVTVSASSRREIFDLGFTHFNNIEIIPNGVSSSLYVQYPKTSYPSFLYVGRLKEYKNIDIAIKAFARVLRTQKDAQFSILGWGESYPQLQKLVQKLNIGHAVKFYGVVSEKEKARFLSQSWAAVQPSLVEGWGITVIEANAAGTPVIASRVNGLQDSVIDGKTGLLAEMGNISQFATAMQVMITDEALRARFSGNAYEWSFNFNWDKSADAFYRLIGRTVEDQTKKHLVFSEVFAPK